MTKNLVLFFKYIDFDLWLQLNKYFRPLNLLYNEDFCVVMYYNVQKINKNLPLSNTMGALGPMRIAIAPAPPVGLALPSAYTAISPATTNA